MSSYMPLTWRAEPGKVGIVGELGGVELRNNQVIELLTDAGPIRGMWTDGGYRGNLNIQFDAGRCQSNLILHFGIPARIVVEEVALEGTGTLLLAAPAGEAEA